MPAASSERRVVSDPLQQPPQARRRGIYLLPNLFTTGALFAGFYGIVAAAQGRYEAAAMAVFIAIVLDGLDGRIARMTNTQSAFGAEYDSLADMVSFGLAPALIAYHWGLQALGKPGWMAAFVYAAATALRLARFNTQVGRADRRYFQGLPSPAAAALVAGLVWVGGRGALHGTGAAGVVTWLVCVAAALAMVSNMRYSSFKELDLRGRVPFVAVLAIVLAFALVAMEPALVLFAGFVVYALSGPATTLVQRQRRRRERRPRGG